MNNPATLASQQRWSAACEYLYEVVMVNHCLSSNFLDYIDLRGLKNRSGARAAWERPRQE